jgi:hypothetical protein
MAGWEGRGIKWIVFLSDCLTYSRPVHISDYKTPTEEVKDIIPSTVIEGNYHNFSCRKSHHHHQKPRSEDRSNLVRRSSVPVNHFAFGAKIQQQSYPPATRRCSGLPVQQNPVFVHRGPETSHTSGMPGTGSRQLDLPVRYFSSSALYCQSGASTPTPSEDEVDWDTSLCVDEDKFKSRLWGKEL